MIRFRLLPTLPAIALLAMQSIPNDLPAQTGDSKSTRQSPSPSVKVLSVEKLTVREAPVLPGDGLLLDAGVPTTQYGDIAPFVSRFVQPRLREGEEIKGLGKTSLVALVRPQQHAWLRRFVEFNTGLGDHVMTMVCKFVRMDDRAFRKIAVPLLQRRGKRVKHVVLAKGEKTDNFLNNLERFRGVDVIHSPELTTFPVQRADLCILSQTSYVKDFQPEFDDKGRPSAFEPVIGIVQSGIWMQCECGMIERGLAGLSLHARCSDLKTPIRKVEMKVKDFASTLEIQVPELDVADIKADVRLPIGGAAVFELPELQGGRVLAFVTVTQTPYDKIEAPGNRKR